MNTTAIKCIGLFRCRRCLTHSLYTPRLYVVSCRKRDARLLWRCCGNLDDFQTRARFPLHLAAYRSKLSSTKLGLPYIGPDFIQNGVIRKTTNDSLRHNTPVTDDHIAILLRYYNDIDTRALLASELIRISSEGCQ